MAFLRTSASCNSQQYPSLVGRWLIISSAFCLIPFVSSKVLIGTSNELRLKSVPQTATSSNIVAIISSPGTTSSLFADVEDEEYYLALDDKTNECLFCRGPTMSTEPDSPELLSIATCSMVASTVVLDGVTEGDVVQESSEDSGGLINSRHGVTLTMLFRAKLCNPENKKKQSLVLCIPSGSKHEEESVRTQVQLLYAAVISETKQEEASLQFQDLYDLEIRSVSPNESEEVIRMAMENGKSDESESEDLSSALLNAQKVIKETAITSLVLNSPHVATAFLAVTNAYTKQSKFARAKIASWKSRSSRGLLIESFGAKVEQLIERTKETYDRETLFVVGLPNVSTSRKLLRKQLLDVLESAIPQLYEEQVTNLEELALRRFRNQLLKRTVSSSTDGTGKNGIYDREEKNMEESAAILRAAALTFETTIESLNVPSLNLPYANIIRKFNENLQTELEAFPESSMAKIKRFKSVDKVVNRERKPSERSLSFGIDLVAMLRPDGFGSLQGFCGYQLPGSSVTFGIHNDADDPQVISQFGGLRPPLLRVQPKLKVDLEM